MKVSSRSFMIGAALGLSASVASAAGYCSLGTATGTITKPNNSSVTYTLATGNVTFNTVASDDCYGPVDLSNENASTIESTANGLNTLQLWQDNWTFLVKDDSSGNSGPSSAFSGYTFTIAANNGQNGNPTPESWTLTVGGTPVPFQMDFLIYLHAGDAGGAYYLFDDRQINASNTGTFSITFMNNGGQFPGLSGISILGRDVQEFGCTENCNPSIPEPASLALAGLALAGLGVARRRRSTLRG